MVGIKVHFLWKFNFNSDTHMCSFCVNYFSIVNIFALLIILNPSFDDFYNLVQLGNSAKSFLRSKELILTQSFLDQVKESEGIPFTCTSTGYEIVCIH